MTIATLTDTHAGARSSSSIFREYMKFWYDTEFFPHLKANNIKTVFHLGDFFDNRNHISLSDIDFIINWFAKRLIEDDVKMHIILGNHDVAFKNSNAIHSLSILQAAAPKHVFVVDRPAMLHYEGAHFAMIPWINSSNYDETFEFLNGLEGKDQIIVAGHFEFAGAKHYKNSAPADHGMDMALFKEFKEVWSGHFHHKSKIGNVRYMGSAFHLNWQDYGDERGFHTYESDTLTFVENDTCMFIQITFKKDVFKAMKDAEYSDLFEGMFVRMIVDGEYDKVALMDTISKINRAKPHDLQVINNAMLNVKTEDNAVETESKTSLTTDQYITNYIGERDDYNHSSIIEKMNGLYKRAQEKMTNGE